MRKLLTQGFAPKTLASYRLRSYGAAKTQLGLSARHEQGLQQNNRAENSHLPVRATRAEDATFQIARIGATVPIHSHRRP
jgi:transposase-like protein